MSLCGHLYISQNHTVVVPADPGCPVWAWTNCTSSASLTASASPRNRAREATNMSGVSTVQARLLTDEDRERVVETLKALEESGQLPQAVQEPVLRLLRLVADGRGAAVLDTDEDLTSNQAVQLLGVSRPFLNKLLDEARIPF